MWFDVQRALAEIEKGTPLSAERTPVQEIPQRPRVANVAGVATLPAAKTLLSAADQHQHITTFDGRPKTWTGRIVSLAAWRSLTEWERHGPNGRLQNTITKQWEHSKGNEQ